MFKAAGGALGVWLCALGLGACEDTGDEGESTTPASSAAEAEFPTLYAQNYCELLQECCTLSGGVPDQDCVNSVETRMHEVAEIARAAGATFDAARAAECLEMQDTTNCAIDEITYLRVRSPACEVWRGHTAPGGDCIDPSECEEPPRASAICIGGQCTQVFRLDPGTSCIPGDIYHQCDQLIAVCDNEVSECVALPAPGDACNGECRAGSRCDEALGECVELGSVGDSCETDNECQSDACRGGHCASLLADSDRCRLP